MIVVWPRVRTRPVCHSPTMSKGRTSILHLRLRLQLPETECKQEQGWASPGHRWEHRMAQTVRNIDPLTDTVNAATNTTKTARRNGNRKDDSRSSEACTICSFSVSRALVAAQRERRDQHGAAIAAGHSTKSDEVQATWKCEMNGQRREDEGVEQPCRMGQSSSKRTFVEQQDRGVLDNGCT